MSHRKSSRLSNNAKASIFRMIALAIILSSAPSSTFASEQGEKSYQQNCASCHGVNGEGNDALGSPALAAQQATYLNRQLQNFSSGLRGSDPKDTFGAQMIAMSGLVKDQQSRDAINSYLGALAVPAQTTEKGDVANGYKYYQTCGSCHGAKAEGNEALNSPRLAGLSAAYLKRQHGNFISGLRGTHADDLFGRQMSMMAATMTDEKIIDDVIAYIVSLSK